MGFYTCCKICTSCQAGNMSLWRQTFLCQWVSATSSSTCLRPSLPARQNICRHGDNYLDIGRYGDRMWSWRHLGSSKLVFFSYHFPLWRQYVARATNCFFLLLFVFLSFVQVLITYFLHKWVK